MTGAPAKRVPVRDRITYAEASLITGLGHHQLWRRARAGDIRRASAAKYTRLSRTDCEQLALQQYRRKRHTPYWMTAAEAAVVLDVDRTYVYLLPLTPYRTAMGDQLFRRRDVETLAQHRHDVGLTAEAAARRNGRRGTTPDPPP